MVAAMSAGGMPDVDIARQLGITREEVRLVLTLSRPSPGADPATYLKPPAGRDGEMGQAPGQSGSFNRLVAQVYGGWHKKELEVSE